MKGGGREGHSLASVKTITFVFVFIFTQVSLRFPPPSCIFKLFKIVRRLL
jgi:hypothetical protein